MRHLLLSFILLSVFTLTNLNAQVDTLWTKQYGGTGNEPANYGPPGQAKLAISEEGNIFAASVTTSNDGDVNANYGVGDTWVIKLNSEGDTIWTRVIGGSNGDIPTDIAALNDGGCIVTGYTYSDDAGGLLPGHQPGIQPHEDGFAARIDSAGSIVWSKQFGGPASATSFGHDFINCVKPLSNGNFLMIGSTSSNAGDVPLDLTKYYAGWILEVDANGTIVHSQKIASESHNEKTTNIITDFIELKDGSGYILLGGVSYYPPPMMNLIMKFDKAYNKVWETELGGSYDNIPYKIMEAENGNIVFSGLLINTGRGDVTAPYIGGSTDIWIVKLDSLGNKLNDMTFGGSGEEIVQDISMDGKGNYFVVGSTNSNDNYAVGGFPGSFSDFWILNLNTSLDTNWTKKFGGFENGESITEILPVDNGSNFIAIGRTNSTDGYCPNPIGGNDLWIGKMNNPAPANKYIVCGDSAQIRYYGNYKGINTLSYSWSPATAIDNTTSATPKTAPLQTTTYYLTVTDNASFTDYDSVVVNIDQLNVNAGFDKNIYCNDSIRLSTVLNTNTQLAYSWNAYFIDDSTANNPIVFPDTTTQYIVSVTAPNGCSATDDIIIQKNAPVEICIISQMFNKNRIIWEKPKTSSIDSFYVYRETDIPDAYEKIVSRHSSLTAMHLDNQVSIDDKAYNYKISAYACGAELELSSPHRSIHLDAVFSKDTAWNLAWSKYEGIDIKKYAIYRGPTAGSLEKINETFKSVFTYKDIDAPTGDMYYQIQGYYDYACNPYDAEGLGFSTISSNIVLVSADSTLVSFGDNVLENVPDRKDIYFEDFESGSMPADITVLEYDNLDMYTVISHYESKWIVEPDLDDLSGNMNAAASSWFKEPGKADDWMILPKLSINEDAILTWKARSFARTLPEEYEIRLSTSGKNTEDFIHVLYATTAENDIWTSRVIDISSYGFENQDVYIAFRYVSNDKLFLAIDDIQVFTADSLRDIEVLTSEVSEFTVMNTSNTINGKLINYGTERITSLKLNYIVNNGSVVSEEFTGLDISAYRQYRYSMSNAWIPPTEGTYTMKIWASKLNGKEDEKHDNDTLVRTIQVLKEFPVKRVLIEEFTGAWCGYCPGGAVTLEKIMEDNSNVLGVAIHTSDIMTNDDGGYVAGAYVSGVPAVIIDRYKFPEKTGVATANQSEWADLTDTRSQMDVPVTVSATHVFDSITRELTVDISALMFADLSGAYRFNCYIIEDSVFNTDPAYHQTNYYNGDASHPMGDRGNPITDYYHRHVLRSMLGGSWGTASSLPSTLEKGKTYTHKFTSTLNADIDYSQVKILVLVQKFAVDYNDREILNVSVSETYTDIAIRENQLDKNRMTLYPNPATDHTSLIIAMEKKQKAEIKIVDATGRVVMRKHIGENLPQNNYQLDIPLTNFKKGIYILSVESGDSTWHKKLVVTK